jgi:hypothetical protein
MCNPWNRLSKLYISTMRCPVLFCGIIKDYIIDQPLIIHLVIQICRNIRNDLFLLSTIIDRIL